MGPSPSHVYTKLSYLDTNTFTGQREVIFEVSPDEKAFSVDFTSLLFSQKPEDVVKLFYRPDQNMIVDIMMDPVVFTQVSTPTEVWREVVAPLFTGVDDTKPYIHQLLNAYYKFLKERPNIYMDDEDKRIELLKEEIRMEKSTVATIHSNYKDVTPLINDNDLHEFGLDHEDLNFESLLNLLTSKENLSNPNNSNSHTDFLHRNPHNFVPVYHPFYDQITNKLCPLIHDAFSAYVAVKWGFFAGDITPIFAALNFLVKIPQNQRDSKSNPIHYSFPYIQSVLTSFSFENAIFLPNNKKISHTTLSRFKMSSKTSASIMACNGKFIYILGAYGVLKMVSLSHFINNPELRFRTFDFQIKEKKRIGSFIAFSNGYLIVGGNFIKHEKIYSTQPFEKTGDSVTYEVKGLFKNPPKLAAPLACDGVYIYSLIKSKKIAIFSLTANSIIFHRFLTLKKGEVELLEPFKHLFPKSWIETAAMYTNGVFLSFVVLSKSNKTQFEYFIRTFSLASGTHVHDYVVTFRWPLQGFTYDPWNQCMWSISPSLTDVSLLKIPTSSSMPSWLTGSGIEQYNPETDLVAISSNFKATKTATNLMNNIIDLFGYIGLHYCGANFNAFTTNPLMTYHIRTAQFLGSATEKLFVSLVDMIEFFISKYQEKTNNGDWTDPNRIIFILKTLFSILQYNLSNSDQRREVVFPSEEVQLQILNLAEKILNNDELEVLFANSAFLILSCFHILLSNRLTRCPAIFYRIFSKSSFDEYINFMIHIFYLNFSLPYCISNETCRTIINPLFESLISKSPDNNMKSNDNQLKQLEFISQLQASLMIEMRHIYTNYQILSEAQIQVQNAFFAYSNCMSEKMINFLNIPDTTIIEKFIKYSIIFRLFRKWLMFLQPLARFNRVSQTLVFYLHSLYTPFQRIMERLHKTLLNDAGSDFDSTSKIFNELFSIYIDFISSLLNGGEELQGATQYIWLVQSTIHSNIQPKDIDQIANVVLDPNTPIYEIKEILSRKDNNENNVDMRPNEDQIESLIIDLIAQGIKPVENNEIKKLFDFLYSKVKTKPYLAKINDKDKYLERLIFFAFMKQLGFGHEVVELNMNMDQDNEAILSHFIKMVIESIYRIRREFRQSKQSSIQNNTVAEYEQYIENTKKKCIFLIYIRSSIQIEQNDIDSLFTDNLKKIQNFIMAKIDMNQCFDLFKSAEKARKHISTGLRLVNNIIQTGPNLPNLTTFMVDKLLASESIMKSLATLNLSADDKRSDTSFQNVLTLLNLLSKMIAEVKDESISNTLIIFYSNLVLTISKIKSKTIFEPLKNLLSQLANKKESLSSVYSSYISLVSSCLYAIVYESPNLAQSTNFNEIIRILFPSKELTESQLSIMRLCLSAGLKVDAFSPEDIISYIKSCQPASYHIAFLLLLELIKQSPNKKAIFRFILKEIASICSGAFSSFMQDSSSMINATASSKCVKTSTILLGACSDLIQICRRCLASDGECKTVLILIIKYILSTSNQQTSESLIDLASAESSSEQFNEFKAFKSPLYLFAVFAIFSNTIDTFRIYSMIKDTSNSAIFYLKNIDQKQRTYTCWQLPITGKSIQKSINYSSDLTPISLMPFSPELFPEYDVLIPYFTQAIDGRRTSNREDALDFFILSSFITYLSDKNFLRLYSQKMLNDKSLQFRIETISFDNSSNDFISILKMHLSDHSTGFSMNQTNSSRLLHCSPAHISSVSNYEVTGNEIKCKSGTHVFISSLLNSNQPTYLELSIVTPGNFNVGVHSFSSSPATSATYLLSYKTHQIVYNSCIIKTVQFSDKSRSITVAINPLKNKSSFYDTQTSQKLHSYQFPVKQSCFIIQTFDNVHIKYHLSHVPILSKSISISNAQFLCPMSGKAVFKRNSIFKKYKTKEEVHNKTFSEIIKESNIDSKCEFTFDSRIFSVNFVSLNETPPLQFAKENMIISPFITYPMNVIKSIGKSLNTKIQKNSNPEEPKYATENYPDVSNSSLKTPTAAYYEADSSSTPLTYKFERVEDAICVDENTGEVEKIPETELHPVYFIQPLHPSFYPIMPTEILNLFTTGTISQIRHKVKNFIVLQSLASPTIAQAPLPSSPGTVLRSTSSSQSLGLANLAKSMDSIFQTFQMSTEQILEYSIALMLFLEPLHFQLINEQISPVDFEVNVLNRTQLISSSKSLHKSALTNIFTYFKAKEQSIELIDIWFSRLERQFYNIQSHFIFHNHPSALIFPTTSLKEPKQITIPGASSLMIFKTGFSRNAPVYANVLKINKDGTEFSSRISNAGPLTRIPISNNIGFIDGDSIELSLVKMKEDVSIVVLPVYSSSNESLFNTFIQLGISFKYFINFLVHHIHDVDNTKLHNIRTKLYMFFIDSYISESPFFYYFGQNVLKFLRTSLPTSGSDFSEDMPVKLSLLALYTSSNRPPFINQFLEEQQMMWDERMLLPLKSFFPEFQTEADKRELSQLNESEKVWGIPSPPLPSSLPPSFEGAEEDCQQLGGQLKRLLKPYTSISGYPFHLLIHIWVQYASKYPPFEMTKISEEKIKVKFSFYVPQSVKFICRDQVIPSINYSLNEDMSTSSVISDSTTHTVVLNGDTIYLEFVSSGSWSTLPFAFECSKGEPLDDFLFKFRNNFVEDVKSLVFNWDSMNDEKFLSLFPLNLFSSPKISLLIPSQYILQQFQPLPIHLMCIRATLLFALNWLLYFDKISFENDPSLKILCKSMSMSLRIGRFKQLIEAQSNDDTNEIQIDRGKALEIRNGLSDDLSMTIIAQLTQRYLEKDPRAFRRKGDKPWRVQLVDESGIDAGGPGRELVFEAAKDLVSPCCGLFMQTPNGRNEIGSNRDVVIPIADPRILNYLNQYKFAGVLIGIIIRSSIVQDLNIAPFVWDYLASGVLTVENIFSVDENYRVLIESLMEAVKSGMDEATFESKFNLRFVVYDFHGQEVPLTQRGRTDRVTLSNCSEFISLANEYRMGEMKQNLEAFREGLWENLNFKPPAFISGELLEYLACGNKEITYEAMVKIIKFEGVSSDQQEYFLRVVQTMTSEQRSELLKFSTGRVRLPASYETQLSLRVDRSDGVRDKLPTASTCFNQFHMPYYSSFDMALKMILIAIEYTGTFENR